LAASRCYRSNGLRSFVHPLTDETLPQHLIRSDGRSDLVGTGLSQWAIRSVDGKNSSRIDRPGVDAAGQCLLVSAGRSLPRYEELVTIMKARGVLPPLLARAPKPISDDGRDDPRTTILAMRSSSIRFADRGSDGVAVSSPPPTPSGSAKPESPPSQELQSLEAALQSKVLPKAAGSIWDRIGFTDFEEAIKDWSVQKQHEALAELIQEIRVGQGTAGRRGFDSSRVEMIFRPPYNQE
jgi:hypothetical protein